MSEDEIVVFLRAADTRGVFLCRFTDGTELEITDPSVRNNPDGKFECIATLVREAGGVHVAAGRALCFELAEVAELKLSPNPFEYLR
jgi:hypothetical protein